MEEIKPLNLESDIAKPASKPAKKKLLLWFLTVVVLGVASGYGLYYSKQPKPVKELSRTAENGLEPGTSFGVVDEKAFRDSAEGELASGGINGEGSHHLIREGGESQYVYLTSSIVDLDQFVGKKVKVWGETFEAQKAGWLMDVGRLQILE